MFFKLYRFFIEIPRNIIIFFIKIYQKTLSPDHGLLKGVFPQGVCRFTPTCSEYGIQAFKKYGVIKGAKKTIWRIIRCNPFNPGGHDPLK
ncbi:MAG: membrane protein insertion efficiency factor YidD [Patescibacteria group bacterium]|jgi:putative membrane protein insertion efficiency factor